ncbi:MAG: chemotaxis protein CheD [Desulfatibacillum sp.]|nr:chemotaxis protein CheD [Desulfatibacillum sp.]
MTGGNNIPAEADYFLRPAYIFVPSKPTLISTVLGTCVAVSLFDKKRRIGGMSHFKYPRISDPQKATAHFGNVAIPALINMLVESGSRVRHLEAQIFGGAYNSEFSREDVGQENVELARLVLQKKGVKVVSEDVGGAMGRKLVFHSQKNETAVMKVERLRPADWYPYEGDR